MAAPAPARPISIKSREAGRAGGVLPAPSISDKSRTNHLNGTPSRSSAQRLKVIVRRLAPGLTEAEFSTFLGDEWKAGNSRTDWISYRQGRISKE